tara:strand:- start:1198 stop:2046 length:849 start_codon:yes stop_codon:yes gene_type:complete
MSRNSSRLGAEQPQNSDAPPREKSFDPLHFVAPTEFVELPSKGMGYPENHPLHNQETVEIRYMTAKDEDILSSRALLKKGVALERFMENIIVDKSIKPEGLLTGDRNAIIIAARVSGYGSNYETLVTCPACGSKETYSFDLNNRKVHEPTFTDELNITKTENGTFTTVMPHTKFNVEFKLLRGQDETYLATLLEDKRRRKIVESALSDQYRTMIVSIEGHTDGAIINRYVQNMPTLDSRHLRMCYKMMSPDVKIENNFVCSTCDHAEEVNVPFGTDFFWPDR